MTTTLRAYVAAVPLANLEASDRAAADDLRTSWGQLATIIACVRRLARSGGMGAVVVACDEVAMVVLDAVDRVSSVDASGKCQTKAEREATVRAVASSWALEREALTSAVCERMTAAVA